MLDTSVFQSALTPPSEGEPGLDTLDARFQDIVGQVQEGQFQEAAQKIQGVIGEGVFDIRLLGYYFYGVFLERGLPAFGEILDAFILMFQESWEAIGPVRKKERHAANGLLWMFTRLLRKLEQDQAKATPAWQDWLRTVNADQAGELEEKIGKLRRAMGPVLEAPKVTQLLPKLSSWFTEYQKLVYEPEPSPEAEAETPAEAGAPAAAQPAAASAAAPAAGGAVPAPAAPGVQGSHHLQLLIEKMEAFCLLGKKDQFEKAAVVAADVNQLIEEFDPRRYLPTLFADYYRQLSDVVREVEPHLDEEDSLRWKYLSQLYHVDLQAFIEA